MSLPLLRRSIMALQRNDVGANHQTDGHVISIGLPLTSLIDELGARSSGSVVQTNFGLPHYFFAL